MLQLTGVLTGVGLTIVTIYAVAPQQAEQIQQQAQQHIDQSGMSLVETLFNETPHQTFKTDSSPSTIEQPIPDLEALQTKEHDAITLLETGSEKNTDNEQKSHVDTELIKLLEATEKSSQLKTNSATETLPLDAGYKEQRVIFWDAFENHQQAQAFINYLKNKTGFEFEVITHNKGKKEIYQTALTVPDSTDANNMLNVIKQSTGLSIKPQNAG